MRNFLGGDLSGVLQELRAGYFDSLGVDAIWMTPFVEQIHGSVDEGTGRTYGFHGYWTRDWTAVDPAFGTAEELQAVVAEAHRRGIRVLMDAVGARRIDVALRDEDQGMELSDWIESDNFNPSYLMRGLKLMPRKGDKPEWRHNQDYWAERIEIPATNCTLRSSFRTAGVVPQR